MAYSLVVGQLVKDNPHADGWFNTLSTGRFAIGRDWEALEARDDKPGFSPDVAGQYGWEYNNRFEYIDRLGCIAPMGTFTPTDMSLATFPTRQGKWKLSSSSAYLKQRVLWFYDSTPNLYPTGAWGQARTSAAYTPNVQFGIWRNGPSPGEAQVPVVYIQFHGNNNEQYALHLPAQGATGELHKEMTDREGEQYAQAILYGRKGSGKWTVVDTYGAGSAPTLAKHNAQPTFQAVRIEHLQNALLIRLGDSGTWMVTGPWYDVDGAEVSTITLADGQIEVGFIGHAGCFAMHPLAYPTSATIRPRRGFLVDRCWSTATAYKIIAHGPAGTGITAAEATGPVTGGTGSWPVCAFTGNGSNRAQLFAVQEYRPAVISAGVSAEQTTNDNNNFSLVSMSGQVSEDYKGSTMTATVEAKPGYSLATIGANSKLRAAVNVHGGGTHAKYDYGNFSTQFLGYAGPPQKAKPAGPYGNMTAEVSAADLVEARLRGTEMYHQCSFEGNDRGTGWTVGGAFEYLLNAAGVPPANIYVDPAITGLQMPYSTVPGKRLFKFAPDTDYAQALDLIAGAVGTYSATRTSPVQGWRGLQWGVNPQGRSADRAKVVQLVPSYEHATGKYQLGETVRTAASDGWTVDAYTTTPEDMISNLRSERSLDDFCNFLVLMQGEGVDAAAKFLPDERSWSDASYTRFIGQLKTRFEAYPDGTNLQARAEDLWERIARWHWLLSWTMDDCPWLLPQDEARIVPGGLATDLELPTDGSLIVFEIISKSWSADAKGRYSQTIQAVRVE